FFFFQAEDGIRDYKVTGVQTCALPISSAAETRALPSTGRAVAACASGTGAIEVRKAAVTAATSVLTHTTAAVIWLECTGSHRARSEERRVGKECRCRWSAENEKKKRIR